MKLTKPQEDALLYLKLEGTLPRMACVTVRKLLALGLIADDPITLRAVLTPKAIAYLDAKHAMRTGE